MTAYFDYFATTPLDERVYQKLCKDLADITIQANTSSMHILGRNANELFNECKFKLQNITKSLSDTFVFTSSSTESIHLAILGAILAYPRYSYDILTYDTEHSATLGSFSICRKYHGAKTHILKMKNGMICLDELEDYLKKNNIFLISISAVGHELGQINPYAEVAKLCDKYGTLLHLDASQAVGKIPFYLNDVNADYVTLSSHKNFGPKGIASLYIASEKNRKIKALFHGGGQQDNMRSSTISLALVRSMVNAYMYSYNEYDERLSINKNYQDTIFKHIKKYNIIDHGLNLSRVSQCAYIYINPKYKDIWESNILASKGSACSHAQGILSPALLNLGIDPEIINSSYRLSWSHLTNCKDLDLLFHILEKIISIESRI